MTTTVGIDLASQAAGTAVCAIEWDGQPTVAALMRGVIDETSKTPLDDKMIASVMRTDHGAIPADVTKIAIDAPFGWPSAFVDALAGRDSWPGAGAGVNPALTRRRTDHWISKVAHKTPVENGESTVSPITSEDATSLAVRRARRRTYSFGGGQRPGDSPGPTGGSAIWRMVNGVH